MLSAALPVLSGQLLAVGSGYVTVRPCIADLLARALHIDAVVIALPASMQAYQAPQAVWSLWRMCSNCPRLAACLHHRRTDVRLVPSQPKALSQALSSGVTAACAHGLQF